MAILTIMTNLTIEIKSKQYPVEIIKKHNKNTYIRVRDNKIVVTTSFWVSNRKIQKLLLDNKAAIAKMLIKYEETTKKSDDFFLFGQKYDLIFDETVSEVTLGKDTIIAKNERQLTKWITQILSTTYKDHLTYWYDKFEEKIPLPNLKIRKMKSRWGVCNTKNNNVTLNSELIRYNITCLDYVIVHELSHFLVPNHSKTFWNQVAKYCPNYKEIRKQLRK